jgi:endonuclease/exonuclease/phosphatase family metal-dependent hydrolase
MAPAKVGRLSGLRALGAAPTFPADGPETQLDHILTDDGGLRVDSCHAPRLPISDHRALVVDISKA